MAGNTPNVSRNSFDYSKGYGPVKLQAGVPIMDSDVNETVDNLWIRGINVANHALIGDCRLPHTKLDGTANANSGMRVIEHATVNTNDFTVTEGWAIVGGVLVNSTDASPPASFDYNDQVMFTGTVGSVAAGAITDSYKNWSADHNLVNCRVKMTSGAEIGNTFTITSLDSATTVSLSGGTGSIAPTDTYEIYPPALTTPSGAGRNDLVYLQVFYDDTSTEEDSSIQHPGTGVESVHKEKIVSVVRVLEGSTTLPSAAEANLISYGTRYLSMATLARLNGDATITTAMITNTSNIKSPLGNLQAKDVSVDAESGSPSSLSSGTLQSVVGAVLGLVNDRIKTVHPTASPGNNTLLWRSGNITSDANVTDGTVSFYINSDGFIIVVGGYIDSSGNVISGTAGGPVTYTQFGGNNVHCEQSSPGISATLNPGSSTDWGTYAIKHNTNQYISLYNSFIKLNSGSSIEGHLISIGSSEMNLLFQSGEVSGGNSDRVRIYFGATFAANPHFWITHNAYWNQSSQKWNKDFSGRARAICLNSYGVYFCHADPTDAASWDYSPQTGWPTSQLFIGTSAEIAAYTYGCPVNYGDTHERVGFAMEAKNPRGTSDTSGRLIKQSRSFRGKWSTPPTSLVITESAANMSAAVTAANFSGSGGNWGFVIYGETNALSAGTYGSSFGYVDAYS